MAKQANNLKGKQKNTAKPKTVVPPTEESVIETVEQPKAKTTDISPKNLVGSTRSALDANHRVDLLNLTNKVFREDPDASRKYSMDFLGAMDTIVAAGIVCALADEAAFGEGSFSAVLNHTLYPQLVVAAKELGVTLPTAKALPVDKEGNVTIESKQVKVSKETKQKLEEEKAIEEEVPELDPVKVANMDEAALKDALQYMLVTGPKKQKIKDVLVGVVDFMRTYRMTLADKAENAAEAKLKYDDYTTGQWLEDAFSHVTPTFLLHGIGRGLVTTVGLEKSPISAFCVLRKNMTKADGTIDWDDQSIAHACKAIMQFVANDCIKKEKANLEALDPKAKDYEEVKKKYETSIMNYQDRINWIEDVDSGLVDNLVQGVEDNDPVLGKIYNRIRDQYYPGKSREIYKNLDQNVVQRAGIILNMFKTPGTENKNYDESNLSELVQYTDEELKEIEKAKLEAKKAEKEAEGKND